MTVTYLRNADRIDCFVPVTTTDTVEFCKSVDQEKMADEVAKFISEKLYEKIGFASSYILTSVQHSFDAFIAAGVVTNGSNLIFSATVSKKDDRIIIKFKDNGNRIDEASIRRNSPPIRFSGHVNPEDNSVIVNFEDNVEVIEDDDRDGIYSGTTFQLFADIGNINDIQRAFDIRIKIRDYKKERMRREDIFEKVKGEKLIEVDEFKNSQPHAYFSKLGLADLSHVKRNIEPLGGTLQLKNRKIRGRTVIVTLPAT